MVCLAVWGVTGCGDSSIVGPPTRGAGVITTWAGTGVASWDGDGNFLLQSDLYFPNDLMITEDGETYILDWNNHRVRYLESDGTLRTVIGTLGVGDGPLAGDDFYPGGAPGTDVLLNHPTHLTLMPDQTILLTAWHNHKLRILDPVTGMVTVVAGDRAGYSGDGGPALTAQLNQPTQSIFGPDGDLYILDQRNHVIRKIDLNGGSSIVDATITTVVGTGVPGYSGDGGPPLEAQLEFPAGTNPPPAGALVFDDSGRLYISDTKNHVIRRVDFALNIIETIAGTGSPGYGGDGGSATSASLNNPRDIEFGPDGLLYIADQFNNRVRALSVDEGIISTVAGTGEAGFGGDGGPAIDALLWWPSGLEFDPDGNLYVADVNNNRIRRIDFAAEPETPAPPASPGGLTAEAKSDTEILIEWTYTASGQSGFRVYRNTGSAKDDSLIAVLAADKRSYLDTGLEEKTSYQYRVHSYNLVGESETGVSDTATTFVTDVPLPDGPSGLLLTPTSSSAIGLTWTDNASNEEGYRVYRGQSADEVDSLIATLPTDAEQFDDTMLDHSTTYYYAVFAFNNKGESATGVTGFETTSTLEEDQPPFAPSGLIATALTDNSIELTWTDESDDEDGFEIFRGLTSGSADESVGTVSADATSFVDSGLVEVTTYHYRVRSFNGNGRSTVYAQNSATTLESPPYSLIETYMGTGTPGLGSDGLPPLEVQLYLPMDLDFGPDGLPYIVDWNNHRIRTVIGGIVSTVVGTGQLGDAPEGLATDASLNHPTHVSFDDTYLYLSAWHNSKVMRMDLGTGMLERICGNGQRDYSGDGGPAIDAVIDLPCGTAVDETGRIFISDQANQRIRVIDTDGTISTYAGTGTPGFSGDGGPATEADLHFPGSPQDQSAQPAGRIVLDDIGNLYIADTRNNRIRKVDTQGNISTVAGTGTAAHSGDGGPATSADLRRPRDVAIGPDGNLYIADSENHAIRMVDLITGVITNIAGTGREGSSGDGGHPQDARLWLPWGIAFDPDGNLYVADTGNNKIRIIYK